MANTMLAKLKFIVEQHTDCYIAYPLGMSGGVVGEGVTAREALEDAFSAAQFHVETFGSQVLAEDPVLGASIEDGTVSI